VTFSGFGGPPVHSVFIDSLYFHSTISKLAQTLPTSPNLLKKEGEDFLPPLTSVQFRAPLMRGDSVKLSLVVLLNGSTNRTISGLCCFSKQSKKFLPQLSVDPFYGYPLYTRHSLKNTSGRTS
jgi:hypothetical protein